MSEIKKYKKGDVLFYLGRTRCTVVRDNLKPGGINADDAFLFLRTAQGTPITLPYLEAGDYLTEKPLPLLKKWPPSKTVTN